LKLVAVTPASDSPTAVDIDAHDFHANGLTSAVEVVRPFEALDVDWWARHHCQDRFEFGLNSRDGFVATVDIDSVVAEDSDGGGIKEPPYQ